MNSTSKVQTLVVPKHKPLSYSEKRCILAIHGGMYSVDQIRARDPQTMENLRNAGLVDDASKLTDLGRASIPPKIGFAALDPAIQREIASKGGKNAHKFGAGHQYTAEEARKAGKIGGKIISAREGHMQRIGRIGGLAKRRTKANNPN